MKLLASPLRTLSHLARGFATAGEEAVIEKLRKALSPTAVQVRDTSGGCGTMYQIEVESGQFEGKTVLAQHRLVKQILESDIKQWHGLSLVTRAPQKKRN